MRRAYDGRSGPVRHPLPGIAVVGLTVVVSIAARTRGDVAATAAVSALVVAATARRDPWVARIIVVVLVVAIAAGLRSYDAWRDVDPRHVGPFHGWASVVGDPQPFPSSTRVVLEVEGERFEWWARGRAKRIRVDAWQSGDRVLVHGHRSALDASRAARVAWQHVVGEMTLDWVADTADGGPVARASNRVRDVLERGAAVLPGDDGALFRGLVIGDDRDQPPEMIARFRASGMSHLTAVSGQNVAFLLAALAPVLRRLRPAPRWATTVLVIAWFVALTRFEPSIMRAGAMAGLSATAFALGRERSPARLLCLAVIGLLMIDPLLVGSVGFWLSVGATAGVITIGPWLTARLACLGLLAMPVGVTLGAQVGVVVPAMLVFGRLPLVSVPANLLAVPVAGAVMLYGLPAGLVAGAVPTVAPVVMFPCRVGVRWVDLVAALGERVEPGGDAARLGWALLVCAVVVVVVVGAGKNRGRHGSAPPDR